MAAASASPPSLLRRPNGRLPACTACQARKVACDHRQPVCKRCVDRGKEAECVYASRELTSVTTTPGGQRPSDRAPSPVDHAPGYMGFTSFSSVFEETKNSLSMLQGFHSWLPQPTNERLRQGNDEPPRYLSSPTREMCLVVLRGVPALNMSHFETVNDSPFYRDGWLRMVAERVLSDLHDMFGSSLGLCRVDSQLEEVARVISENTSKPFQEGEPDPAKWLGQFTGRNLRWESVGLIFSYGFMCFPDMSKHGGLDSSSAQKEWAKISRVCLGLCMDLSRRFASANSLVAQLSIRRTTLESIYAGDACYSTWRGGAETVALVTFLGMHDESNSPSYEPSLASESRRRLFAQMFVGDSVLFTGRPPRLSHRFAVTPPPLDLRDEDLIEGGEVVREAVKSLDENGWNTRGKVYPATLTRARYILALVRDELVEIDIVKGREKVASAHLRDLKNRQLEAVKKFPQSLDNNPSDFADPNANLYTIFARTLLQLEKLRNLLLIERLLSKHGEADGGEILLISFQLVSLTLQFWTHKDRFAPFRNDFEWLVMAFATPSGGILCMELLNPTIKGSHPSDPTITRSNIIQKLSLLIGFLEWIDPSRPNGDLCVTTSVVMRHVLDHVLNVANENMSWRPETLDDVQPDFSFELFDTFDWMRPDTLANQAL
ncbi:n-terminal binuclear zn cluster-containing dna binding domain-containing [Trichoderma cornu-damae]|uniref:N-terminal binuclear zn cluster-containing dna binding domain-containing n=1 Tax=Trichoderma cornu-damae TaxID=654480 RepID=A0A9P8TZA5_9HYPO|nr:n-terminal binuclear zn cluster-containing dna binding domain-containing [Trichoderma cornu-damae]